MHDRKIKLQLRLYTTHHGLYCFLIICTFIVFRLKQPFAMRCIRGYLQYLPSGFFLTSFSFAFQPN